MMPQHVKNSDLREQILLSKNNDKLTKEALDMLMIMIKKLSLKYNYAYEQDREDCCSGAILDCLMYWRGYDPLKSENAFAYFTQIQLNGFYKSARKLWNIPQGKKVSISRSNIYTL